MSNPADTRTTDFEREFSDHVGLARRILASAPEDFSERMLDDIGRRARHWVMAAYREWDKVQ